jgi:hypothetical protein
VGAISGQWLRTSALDTAVVTADHVPGAAQFRHAQGQWVRQRRRDNATGLELEAEVKTKHGLQVLTSYVLQKPKWQAQAPR